MLSLVMEPLPLKVREVEVSTQLHREIVDAPLGFAPPQYAYPDPSQQPQMAPAPQGPPQQQQAPPAQGGRGY